MSTLTTPKLALVPEDVTKKYLAGFSAAELKKIEEIYKQVCQSAWAGKTINDSAKPSVVLVVGAQGSGKSTLAQNLRSNSDKSYVTADVDRIIKLIPDVADDLREIAQAAQGEADFGGYNVKRHFNDAEAAIQKWRPAAEYMRDRLLSDSLEAGYDVMMQASGKSVGITKLIKSLQKAGHDVDTHICVAPVSVAILGANTPQHGFAYPKDVISADHAAMRKNIPAIMEAARDSVQLYFRGYADSSSKKVLSVQGNDIVTSVAREAYDAHVADLPYAIAVNDIRNALTPKATGTAPAFRK